VKLPNGIDYVVNANGTVGLANSLLAPKDMAALIRAFFTAIPLKPDDVRRDLIEDIRGSIVIVETKTKKEWVALNPFRDVSLKRARKK